MPLILKPTIRDFSRAELEQHVEGIRTRRMAIAFDHAAASLAGLENSRNRVERRFGEYNAMLAKELASLDRALEKVESRVDKMTQLKQEHDQLRELVESQQVVSKG